MDSKYEDLKTPDIGSVGNQIELRKRLLQHPIRFSVPILFGFRPDRERPPGTRRLWGASGALVHLGRRDLLITNHHVLEGMRQFVKHEGEFSSLPAYGRDDMIFQVADNRLNIYDRLIDISARHDLAVIDATGMTFDRPEYDDDHFVQAQVFKPAQWPGPNVAIGDSVMLGGYLGTWRKVDADMVSHSPLSFAAMKVTSTTNDRFSIRLDRSQWRDEYGTAPPDFKEFTNFGGLSGSPVFLDRKRNSGLFAFDLVGIVSQYLDAPYDVLVVSSADNIRSDGTLKH